MLTPEQILAKLYELRKDYEPEEEQYQALHHAFLFLSYNMEAFKRYVQEETKKSERGA